MVASPRRRHRRLLLADDHAAFRAAARAILGRGFDVVGEAVDGRSTMVQAELLVPDVVVLDVGLPDIDGTKVCAELVRRHQGMVVVLVSVRERADYGDLLDGCGAAGFVPKALLAVDAIEELLGL